MNTSIDYKNSNLIDGLTSFFGEDMNLARIKFLSLFIIALCKVQSVCFEKLATGFDCKATKLSSLRRIQRFMASYVLDVDLISRLVFALLPHKPPYILTMDRTNWQFGATDINILAIGIVYQGVAFPILFKFLPKRGNSNTQERIDIIDRFIQLFGKNAIKELVADREFVGEKWMEYLNSEEIKYHIRIRENFFVDDPRTGKKIKASWMFSHVKLNQIEVLRKIYYVNNQLCYLSASKVKDKNGIPELQILISFNYLENAIESYKDRWQIESMFKAFKSSGFNLEQTHLSDINRMEKLFAVVIIAFVWAYKIGLFLHHNIKEIRMLNHGYRAKSFVKYGLEYIAAILLNANYQDNIGIFDFLSCT
ncbi:MAG: IS4 family transposase [Dysgonamonadaceae bacterium]|nr:IS4 family transposase [Dysgonamonadaceae bacterium]MDY0215862.1 IS4 family transposase [Bacteroidales bacterium]